jgi:putative transposase
MPRKARIVIAGEAHHVVQRGNRRQNVFFKPEDRIYYLSLLEKYSKHHNVEVISYCLMTNHVHLILVPSQSDGLEKVMKPLHMLYAQHINRRFLWKGHLWQARYFSSPLFDDYFWVALRYVEQNSVVAKLASHPAEYQWSSAFLRCNQVPNSLLTRNESWLSQLEMIKDWYSWLVQINNKSEEQFIRLSTARDLPSASQKVLDKLSAKLNRNLSLRQVGRPRNVDVCG